MTFNLPLFLATLLSLPSLPALARVEAVLLPLGLARVDGGAVHVHGAGGVGLKRGRNGVGMFESECWKEDDSAVYTYSLSIEIEGPESSFQKKQASNNVYIG